MATVPLTNEEMQIAIGMKKNSQTPESVHRVPMQVKPNPSGTKTLPMKSEPGSHVITQH